MRGRKKSVQCARKERKALMRLFPREIKNTEANSAIESSPQLSEMPFKTASRKVMPNFDIESTNVSL